MRDCGTGQAILRTVGTGEPRIGSLIVDFIRVELFMSRKSI